MGDVLVRCPDCGVPVVGRPERCASCGLMLAGDAAARLWVVDQSIAALFAERAELLRRLRAVGPVPVIVPYPAPGVVRPRVEWSRRRVQNLLLSLGVLLLTVAALIFIAVNWSTLGAGGRAAVMAVVTLSAAAAATAAARRGLPATAESVAALTVALLIVDSVGLRRTGFATGIAPATYAGATSAVIAVLVAAWLAKVRLKALGIAALVAAEAVVPLVTGTSVRHPAGVAAVYGLETVALLGLQASGAIAKYIDIKVLRVSTYVWWALSLIAAVAAIYGQADERTAWGPVEMLALAAVAVWAARHEAAELHLALATATAIAAACGIVPHVGTTWRAPAVEAAALLAALAVMVIPTPVARASTMVVAATGAGALLTAVKPIMEALTAPGAITAHEVWNSTWTQTRELHATDAIRTDQPWSGTAHLAVLVLTALATAVVLLPKTRAAARQVAIPAVAALVVINLILVPLEAAWTLPIAVAWELALGASLLIAAMMKNPANGRVIAIVGACFLAHAVLWSLRSPALTVTAVGVLLAATAFAARAAQNRDRLVLTTIAALSLPLEAGLVATYQGTSIEQTGIVLAAVAVALMAAAYVPRGWLSPEPNLSTAVQAVALAAAATAIGLAAYEPPALAATTALLIAAIVPAIVLGKEPLKPAWPVIVQALACLEIDGLHRWIAPQADLGSRALVIGAAAAAVSVAVSTFQQRLTPTVLITGPTIYALSTTATVAANHLNQIWLDLLIGGVAAALIAAISAVATRSSEEAANTAAIRLPAAISSLLLLASSWVRLAESHVHAVEPYTVPAAVILLAAGYVRRRNDRDAASWPAYGPGLILGLTPTLFQALADPGLVRPVLVGVASLAVLAAGIRGRLQAPLAIGATALAIDVTAQLSPALAAAYDAVPRWTLIAMAGALLLAVGVTYERRIRDVRALGRKFGGLR